MEKEFVEWLIQQRQERNPRVKLGIGDDAAVLNLDDPRVVVTTDSIADGVHFDSTRHSLRQIGHKAIAVNLSDLAAMGAMPVTATVNFFCPRHFELADVQELYRGMRDSAAQFDTVIVGGDTNRWDGKLALGATALGVAWPQAKTEFWTLNGAVAGDWILVSGPLGGSILGKHIDFLPQVTLAGYLMQRYRIHAATDISDSLAIDLAAIAGHSGCGFRIFSDKVPIASAALQRADGGQQSALEHALYDGEDFELALCVAESEAVRLLRDIDAPVALHHIGFMTQEKSMMIAESADQPSRQLEIRGYVH